MKTEDFNLSLRIVEGRGLDYGTNVVDSEDLKNELGLIQVRLLRTL